MKATNCKICGSKRINITYHGKIRDGKVGNYTLSDVDMYICEECGVIWHELLKDSVSFYESEEYRNDLEGTSDINDFYTMHDEENTDKFKITGYEYLRNKIVADIGCGGGSFLDYVNTVAKKVIAVEPSETYRKAMAKKGFITYTYSKDALIDYREMIDTVVSFDVIEHVDNPNLFIEEIYNLLSSGGVAFIGTPTDAPIMRKLLGEVYESFLFSTQHPWVLSQGAFEVMAKNIRIENYRFRHYQRYGLGNLLFWLANNKPGRHIGYDFITKGIDAHWKADLEMQGLADYIVFEIKK